MHPHDFPPHQTVYHYCWTCRRAGVWERMHDTLRGDLREASGRTREPSAGIEGVSELLIAALSDSRKNAAPRHLLG